MAVTASCRSMPLNKHTSEAAKGNEVSFNDEKK